MSRCKVCPVQKTTNNHFRSPGDSGNRSTKGHGKCLSTISPELSEGPGKFRAHAEAGWLGTVLQGEPLTSACGRSRCGAQRTPAGLLSHLGMQTWKALPPRKAFCLCHSHGAHVRSSRSSLLSRSAYPHLGHLLLWRKRSVETASSTVPISF